MNSFYSIFSKYGATVPTNIFLMLFFYDRMVSNIASYETDVEKSADYLEDISGFTFNGFNSNHLINSRLSNPLPTIVVSV